MVIIFNLFFFFSLTKSLQQTLIKHPLADINIILSVLRHCDSASCEKIKRDRKIKQGGGEGGKKKKKTLEVLCNLRVLLWTGESASLSLLKNIQGDVHAPENIHGGCGAEEESSN